MKKWYAALSAAAVLFAVFLFIPSSVSGATSYTTVWSEWVQSSLIDSTPIGANSPSTGNFTSLELNSAAPVGHTLVGNGTSYIDTAVKDQYGSVSGCSFANDGGGLSCTAGTITWPAAFADTSYSVSCSVMYTSAIAGGSSTQPSLDVAATVSSTTQISITEGVAQGSSGGFPISSSYGATIYCHAHHS